MKKRATALALLFAVISAASASSCGETKPVVTDPKTETGSAPVVTEAESTAGTKSEFIKDDLADADLGGYLFRIFSSNFINRELGEYISYDTLTGDLVNDALYNATASVEERFNCDISIIRNIGDMGMMGMMVKKAVHANEDAFDIQIAQDHAAVSLAQQGLFYNLFQVEQFNFDKPWWPKKPAENLSIQNKLYVASNYLSYCGLHYTRVLVMDKEKMASLHLEMPYQTVREGTWTLDKLLTLVEDVSIDVNGDGKMDATDYYGFCTGDQTDYSLQESIDLMPYVKNEDGYWELDVDIQKADTFIEKMKYLMNDSGCYIQEGMFGVEPFRTGHALVAYSTLQDVYESYRMSDIKYGIIPSPKYDENQEEYISSCTDTFWAIPTTAVEHIDTLGTIIEALSCMNYNTVIPVYFEVALSQKLADAPEDAEMLRMIRDTRDIGFAYAYEMIFAKMVTDCVKSKGNFSSFYAKREKGARKKLERLMEKYEEME